MPLLFARHGESYGPVSVGRYEQVQVLAGGSDTELTSERKSISFCLASEGFSAESRFMERREEESAKSCEWGGGAGVSRR